MNTYRVAVAGATGAVGQEMLKVLADRQFPVGELKLLASERSVGKTMEFNGQTLTVELLDDNAFKDIDFALFSAGASRSKQFRQACLDAGAVMIDNSSAFRMDEDVPLVVPEVNPEDVKKHQGVIANPNCSTIQMVVALQPIHEAAGIKRVVVSTYQATSGAGAKAMQELVDQTRDVLDDKPISINEFDHQIAFNVIPHIGSFEENGYTQEEMKMINETRKIMSAPDIQVSATTVRVPVLRAHSEAINIETEKKISAGKAVELFEAAPGITVVDDPARKLYPMPKDASGRYDVMVGRIREDISRENALDIYIVADQLLKGAALNAVQIAELLI